MIPMLKTLHPNESNCTKPTSKQKLAIIGIDEKTKCHRCTQVCIHAVTPTVWYGIYLTQNIYLTLILERPAVERVTQKLDNVTLDAGDTHVLDDFLGEDEESSNRAKPKRIAAAVDSEDE